jgi:hypothetical protein
MEIEVTASPKWTRLFTKDADRNTPIRRRGSACHAGALGKVLKYLLSIELVEPSNISILGLFLVAH